MLSRAPNGIPKPWRISSFKFSGSALRRPRGKPPINAKHKSRLGLDKSSAGTTLLAAVNGPIKERDTEYVEHILYPVTTE
ncbi:hypothetical protein PspLS_04735 [Pyricularia sp. CBS 133598]|nr:hypothetical protein PspLS_04735 [Pyricularia sp. CBS 133598]